MAASTLALFVCAFATLVGGAHGNAFRGNLRVSVGNMSAEHIRSTVLSEVMAALGDGHRVTDKRISNLEEVLRPIFVAMPKNEHGNLDDAAARYVLHRLFVQRHAMYIKGLEPGGEAWERNTTTKEVLEDHIPAFVLSLFEERLKDQGLSLHEMTVLAATLEHLIHDEAEGRLKQVFEAYNVSLDDRVTEMQLQKLIDTYMVLFIMGKEPGSYGSDFLVKESDAMQQGYSTWPEVKKFMMQIWTGMIASNAADPNFAADRLSFTAATQIVEEIGERYGRWQNSECLDLKEMLMKIEHRRSGRVLLRDFYGAALNNGTWQFSESVDYLRDLGALDDSNPQQTAIFIANYVNAPSNCVASSSIYSVCCINECEGIMAHLERHMASPEGTVDRILEVTAQLPSATVTAPRELSEELRGRLQDIADHHSGTVPLHGRLFAQWLHHAYPRECPFPHVDGATNPKNPHQWALENGREMGAKRDEMTRVLEEEPAPPEAAVEMPWKAEEQLITRHAQKKPMSITRMGFLVAAGASFCIAIGRMAHDALAKGRNSPLLPYGGKQHAC